MKIIRVIKRMRRIERRSTGCHSFLFVQPLWLHFHFLVFAGLTKSKVCMTSSNLQFNLDLSYEVHNLNQRRRIEKILFANLTFMEFKFSTFYLYREIHNDLANAIHKIENPA